MWINTMRSTFLLLFFTSFVLIATAKINYENYKLYKVHPTTKAHINFLRTLQRKDGLQYWTDVKTAGYPVDILVAPDLQDRFTKMLTSKGLDYEVMISNVQQLIDQENVLMSAKKGFDWTNYHTLDEINDWLSSLAEQYPNIVTLIKAGESYEGRDIMGVHVSFKPNNKNRTVFIEANIHAREWISNAVATFILNELLTSTDKGVRNLAESHDWYVVPVFNPDGFVYTHTDDRLWRKTRTPYDGCYGVDPNRNWGYHWDEGGADNWPCSDIYNGPSAFSEKSSQTLKEFISTIGKDLIGYIGFHSYSQYMLIPYGYTSKHLDNYDELKEVGLLGLQSLRKRYGTQYIIGNVPEILYVASGGSIDWVKGTFKTRITYTYELRDTGRYGFLLPPNQIIPTAEEVLDSLVTIFEEFEKRL